jgi:predicted dehydrogenase
MITHKLLVVGCGSIGERHIRCFGHHPGVEVTGCDINPELREQIARRYEIPCFPNLDKALEEGNFTAAVVATPANLHIPIALRLVRSGLHVLIEKPLSVDLDQTSELLEAITEHQVAAAMAYVYHFFPCFSGLKAHLSQIQPGKLLQVTLGGGQPFQFYRPAYKDTYFKDRKTGGGLIHDGLTHFSNLVEWLFGPADQLVCDCAHQALPDVEVEDSLAILSRNGGALVSYSLNLVQAPTEVTLLANFENGSIKAESHRQRWGWFGRGDEQWTYHDAPMPDRDFPFIKQAHAFLDLMEGKLTDMATIEDGIRAVRVIQAAHKSSEERAWVEL